MTLPACLQNRLRLPVICSPLFIISGPELVIAQCKAGVVGSFPALNARPASQLDEWLHQITEELSAWDRDNPDRPSAPFAVNQIVHKTNDRLEHDLEMCGKYKVPLIITSLGAREDLNEAVHGWGGIVMHDVINDRFARKAVEKGADGLIPVATGAGGHAGTLSPFALVQEIRRWFDGPVALSGSIANGNAILAAQAMGADLAYIGSMFIASEEANAVPPHKQMLVDCNASDIIYSNLFTGVHGNYLAPSIVAAGLDPKALPESDPSKMSFGSGSSSKSKAWRDIWGCGQGIGCIDAVVPAAEHVDRLAAEYSAAKAALDGIVSQPIEPRDPFISSGARVRSTRLVARRAKRAATGFQALGIGAGDAVALLLRNDFAFFEAQRAAALIGAYAVPINWHATAEEAGYILADCGARALVVHRDLVDAVRPGVPAGVEILVVEPAAEIRRAYDLPNYPSPAPDTLDWDRFVEGNAPYDGGPSAFGSAVIYTSGTTGKPKGVLRQPSPANFSNPSERAYGLTMEGPLRVLINGPMYHSAPNSYARLAFARSATIFLQTRFDAEELLALIERHRITHVHMVPTMFVRLLRLPQEVRARYDLSSLRYVVHGAAPCPPAIKRQMIEWWGPVIHEYYGSTEMGVVALHGSEDALRKPGTVGRVTENAEIAILDDAGNRLPAGEVGNVFARAYDLGDFTYLGCDDQRAEITQGELVTVGDMGYLDEEGFLFLADRKRDMIISGGVNIYPAEIEAALLAVDGVEDCAVFGIPDAEFGESVCAHIQPQGGCALDPQAIRDELSRHISRFKIPGTIVFEDALPREDSGKIFKRKLRERYWRETEPA